MEAGGRKKQNKKKLVLLPRRTHAHINVNDHGDGSSLLFLRAAARCELSSEVCLRFVFKGARRGRVRTACLCTPQWSLASPPASWRRLTKPPAITERIISSWSAVLWRIRMQMTVTMILHQLIVDWALRLYIKKTNKTPKNEGETFVIQTYLVRKCRIGIGCVFLRVCTHFSDEKDPNLYLCGLQQLGCSCPHLLQRTRMGQPKQMQERLLTQTGRTGPVPLQTHLNPLAQLLQWRRSLVLVPAAQPGQALHGPANIGFGLGQVAPRAAGTRHRSRYVSPIGPTGKTCRRLTSHVLERLNGSVDCYPWLAEMLASPLC